MYQQERLEQIMQIVKKNGYVTVKYLVSSLHYSNATINRDLNVLVGQGRIRRSYGGVEYVEKKGVPLPFRYHFMRAEKLKIGRKAAELVCDGDTIFIDASTTSSCMVEFLTEKKNLTVISNNMEIIMRLSEYGIQAICLGGKVLEPPCMLYGIETGENAEKYRADKAFFSTGYVSEDGRIGSGEAYYILYKIMVQNAQETYYLASHDKLEEKHPHSRYLFDFSKVHGVISDYDFKEEIHKKYPQTEFYKV